MSWVYRYRRELLGDDELIERCNALGDAGWNMVGPPVWVPGDLERETLGLWRCFFKRTVSDREQVAAAFSLHRPAEDAAR